jgi:hypothetical protein
MARAWVPEWIDSDEDPAVRWRRNMGNGLNVARRGTDFTLRK